MVPQKIKNSDGIQSINRSEQVLNQEKLLYHGIIKVVSIELLVIHLKPDDRGLNYPDAGIRKFCFCSKCMYI